ncbi:hypothetical protein HLI_21040 (plasmid) [Halobacillus litoralis]|uniref:LRAT domain-containing protein n=1 Tax=Halobacillus litoralis TaxID=45668 RepID=A0A410MJA8_9BACI|nr:hypothetical protein HLI_21040 [Halobacillus litoralis]
MNERGITLILLAEFTSTDKLFIRKSIKLFDDDTIVDRAWDRLEEGEYSVLNNNCEHFCNWCRSGLTGLNNDFQSTITDIYFNRIFSYKNIIENVVENE